MTTQVVPLDPVPAQTLSVVLSGQACEISLRTLSTGLYFSLTADGVAICRNTLCLNLARLLIDRGYLGFRGDFVLADTQGDADPEYTGLGTRWVMLYSDTPPSVPEFLA